MWRLIVRGHTGALVRFQSAKKKKRINISTLFVIYLHSYSGVNPFSGL